ncbi:uncharacterized protein LOC111310620 [Durio zibethinus]|uniref:Uncharacterized protein LOC111310620 n=1 Tax=Durio zibethinus TaxID=66656 RepID=A0A6P6ALU2_DURZI|nr:uncharacterized protein LOC111310620 [Durio zibethinus]
MYAEFSRVSLLSMSNSGLFLVKDEEEGSEFDILKRPVLEFQEESQAAATSSHDDEEREIQGDHEEIKGEENNVTATSEESGKKKKMISLGELKATDDDDDGFKTPTSLDHKIPVIKQCPPAPRKPKPLPSNKRKASPSSSNSARTRRNLQLDFSQEVESLCPGALLFGLHCKVKIARSQDHNQ